MTATTLIGEKLGTRSNGIGEQRMRWYRAVYYVRSNRGSISGDTVLTTPGLPRWGDRHPFYTLAFATAVEPRELRETSDLWEVDVRWESRPWQNDDEQVPPWEREAVVRDGDIPIENAKTEDLDGKPYVNTAGDPFDPQPLSPESDLQITIERAQLHYDRIELMPWANTVNSDVWWGFPKYSAKLARPTAEDAYWEHQHYYRVTYSLHVKGGCFDDPPDLWIPLRVLNKGSRELIWDGQNQKFERKWCMDDGGVQATEPQLLNENGTQMTRDELAKNGPHWVEFRQVTARPFSEIFPGT